MLFFSVYSILTSPLNHLLSRMYINNIVWCCLSEEMNIHDLFGNVLSESVQGELRNLVAEMFRVKRPFCPHLCIIYSGSLGH